MLTRNTGYFFQPPCILTTAGAKTQKYSHGVFSHNILVSCYPHLTLHQTNPTPPATSHLNQNRSKLLFFIALWLICLLVCLHSEELRKTEETNKYLTVHEQRQNRPSCWQPHIGHNHNQCATQSVSGVCGQAIQVWSRSKLSLSFVIKLWDLHLTLAN